MLKVDDDDGKKKKDLNKSLSFNHDESDKPQVLKMLIKCPWVRAQSMTQVCQVCEAHLDTILNDNDTLNIDNFGEEDFGPTMRNSVDDFSEEDFGLTICNSVQLSLMHGHIVCNSTHLDDFSSYGAYSGHSPALFKAICHSVLQLERTDWPTLNTHLIDLPFFMMALVLLRLLESLTMLPLTMAQALDQDAALCCEILWFHYCRRHFTRTAACIICLFKTAARCKVMTLLAAKRVKATQSKMESWLESCYRNSKRKTSVWLGLGRVPKMPTQPGPELDPTRPGTATRPGNPAYPSHTLDIVEEDGSGGRDFDEEDVVENSSKESGRELGDETESDVKDPKDIEGETKGEESLASLLAARQLSLPD
ncbi:hypothetical protein BT96DRAFT_948800 [Gymnopus androsaceus JB14]|uniref:Uncharacterized protein n=1 Tax=Gymnopus androsaceus JB14 TaxID=1447944 RepID=A0A6A4GMS1_9AGAR|nr:hypothetical protein BT96DRAFT_948800 [Gymnopus androsaceus JB14]